MHLRFYIFLIALSLPALLCAGNDISTAEAETYAQQERAAWSEVFTAFGVDAQMAEAVIFPELVRYSVLQDYAETAAVAGSYVLLGDKGADYSVGRFQMKPSFVEALERRWMQSPRLVEQYEAWFDTSDTRQARQVRATRMADTLWQCIYLSMFIRLLQLDYPDLALMSPEHRLQWIATAYNRGVRFPREGKGDTAEIESHILDQSYHTDFIALPSTRRYCYASLAHAHYQALISKKEY